jgi:hypothetical protein
MPISIESVRIPRGDPPEPRDAHALLIKPWELPYPGGFISCSTRSEQEQVLHELTAPDTAWYGERVLTTQAPKILAREEVLSEIADSLNQIDSCSRSTLKHHFAINIRQKLNDNSLQVLDLETINKLKRWLCLLKKKSLSSYEALDGRAFETKIDELNGSLTHIFWLEEVVIPLPSVQDADLKAIAFFEDHQRANWLPETLSHDAARLRRRANAHAIALYHQSFPKAKVTVKWVKFLLLVGTALVILFFLPSVILLAEIVWAQAWCLICGLVL